MSHPRIIVPGATYLITRRALRRHLLFRPDAAITQLVIYALAVSALRFNMQVHGLCAMSTHLHLVVTDEHGILPKFLQFFHRLVALGTKVLRGWEGSVWDHEPTSVVRLWTRTAIVEKIAYVAANPVTAGLVRRAHEWAGAKGHVGQAGSTELHAQRPSVYFDPTNSSWPENVTLPLTTPSELVTGSAAAFRRDVCAEIERLEELAQREAEQGGQSVTDPRAACNASPHDRATSPEPLRARNPTFAVGRNQGEAWRRAVAKVREFRTTYRRALERWCAGLRDVVFPAGTWWMRIFHGAQVSEGPLTL